MGAIDPLASSFCAAICRYRFAFTILIAMGFANGASAVLSQELEITYASPISARIGETTTITLHGRNELGTPLSIWTTFGGKCEFVAEPTKEGTPAPKPDPRKLFLQIALPKETSLGTGILRFCTTKGISEPVFLMLEELATVRKGRDGHSREKAQVITLPVAIDAYCDARQSNFYKFELKKGESVSAEAFATRLLSKFDVVLRLLDESGKELVSADDTPGLGSDCRLRHTAANDGAVFLEVRDIAYQGGPNRFFYLRVGDFPLANATFPPVAKVSEATEWRAVGDFVEGIAPRKGIAFEKVGAMAFQSVRWADDKPATFVELQSSTLTPVSEIEPNNNIAQATKVEAPTVVVGQLATIGDRDVFQFPVKKNQRYRIGPQMRDLGSPGELYFRVENEKGEWWAESDNSKPEAQELEFNAKADGFAYLLIEELNRRGGRSYVYAASIETMEASLALQFTGEQFFAAPGKSFEIKVQTKKRPGSEPITLELAGFDGQPLPAGMKLENNVIEKGKNETKLKIILSAEAAPGTIFVARIVGRCKHKDTEIVANATLIPFIPQTKSPLAILPRIPPFMRETIAIGIGPEAK